MAADPAVSEFLADLAQEMSRPLPWPGSRVTVDGRPGILVRFLPGHVPGRPGAFTCTTTYIVNHDGDYVSYVVNDWNPHGPKVALL